MVVSNNHTGSPTRRNDFFSFVIPVAHPDAYNVRSYDHVEEMLRITLGSLLAQTHENISVVVVCHRFPKWGNEVSEKVKFILLPRHHLFAPLVKRKGMLEIDKGLKYILGSLFVLEEVRPVMVMLTDADDLADRQLVGTMFRESVSVQDCDGFILKRGIHALLRRQKEILTLGGVFGVENFEMTCGSCRIYRARSLRNVLRNLHPEFTMYADLLKPDQVSPNRIGVPVDVLNWLDEKTRALREDFNGIVQTIGRHYAQGPLFRLFPLELPLVAKSCGHGNHVGPRRGEVRWDRIYRIYGIRRFRRRFGLSGSGYLPVRLAANANLFAFAQMMNHHWKKLSSPLKRVVVLLLNVASGSSRSSKNLPANRTK